VTLGASSLSITAGTTVTLTWSSANATACTGTGFSTNNAVSGTSQVTPTVTATYKVTCTGTGGSASDSKSITVTPGSTTNPAPTVTLSVNPTSVVLGSAATISWTSTYATACTGTGFSTENAVSGTSQVTPTVTTTYNVTCTGTGGSASDTEAITVTTTIDPITPVLVHIELIKDAKVYKYAGRSSIGTQLVGAKGTYDKNKAPTLRAGKKWVYVDFVSGKDGYVDMALFKTSTETVQAASLMTSVITTDTVRVRKSPNGDILSKQSKGMTGTTDAKETEVIGGYKWVYVDFLTGQDGYVSTAFIQTSQKKSSRDELMEKIKLLRAQIELLQKQLKTR
jgi:hypothetical protein